MAKPWPVSASLSAELVPATEAARLETHWTDLAARALEPNVFYGPAQALPGLVHLPEGRGAEIVAAWRGAGETRRLVGLLPLVRARGRHFNPLPIRRAAAFYGTLSTPLLDPDRPEETLGAMLDAVGAAGTRAVLLPFLHMDGPVATALERACAASGRTIVRSEGHRRALLRSPLAGPDYVRTVLETRRRKEVDRQRRRLGETGTVAFSVASRPDAVAAALEAFLTLESAGWKGRTALLAAPGAAAFVREAARAGAAAGAFRVATLSLDGRTIAAGLVAVAGRRAFYLKTTYDEALARFSPGLLLTLDLTGHLLDDPSIESADSIAVADHPMIDRIWTERFPVASWMVGTRPGTGMGFRAAVSAERWREATVEEAKRRIAQFRRWREPDAKHGAKKSPAATEA